MRTKKPHKKLLKRICQCGEKFETTKEEDRALCIWCDCRELEGMANDSQMGASG
jgi:hypothetical protein